ncbi:methyltransferase domain-containing protein [Colletotrichum salicis]|uniref:Methyltransferase domain-containing protein n=1 Tax=Colletotrichum salicis TaxID=1209931 RepID=A0A135V4A3_9PEZI|nr:methyltransferase domain-containing protein [Colletotrichum salicis]
MSDENNSPTPPPAAAIAPDEVADTDDNSSLNGGSIASSTSTVAASILESRLENGRTYHKYKEGKYWAPNDEREQYGLGTGLWAIEFGEEHEEAEVTGVDLSAIQPNFVPPNVKLEIDDIEEPWTFSEPFDYIHSRMMKGSLRDWKKFLQSSFELVPSRMPVLNLTPGGYLELNDIDFFPISDDDTIPKDSHLMRAFNLCFEALKKMGSPFEEFSRFETMLADVGFEDIQVQQFKWPTNPWPKDKKHKDLGE